MEEPKSVGLYFKIIGDSVSARANRLGRENNITMSQASILEYLAYRENLDTYQHDIESFLSLSHATVSGVLKRMEVKGWVSVQTSSTDRRRKDVVLEEAGRQTCLIIQTIHQKMDAYLTTELTIKEEQQLIQLLQKITTGIKTQKS